MDAAEFAHEWIDAWNAHDLERILSHYAEEIVFTSPYAAQVVPESRGVIRGIDPLRAYWTLGLERNPDLRFELVNVLETTDGITILYRNHRDQFVAETLLFGPEGLVMLGFAAYEQ